MKADNTLFVGENRDARVLLPSVYRMARSLRSCRPSQTVQEIEDNSGKCKPWPVQADCSGLLRLSHMLDYLLHAPPASPRSRRFDRGQLLVCNARCTVIYARVGRERR